MANLHDLERFDPSLLTISECIHQRLSISKAAATPHTTLSAASQSLQRLRTQSNDPLSTRSDKGIAPIVTGVNPHLHLEKNLDNLEQTINIMHGPSLKNEFAICNPQITTDPDVTSLTNNLRENSGIEIEHHNILMSAETAKDVFAYRKADPMITATPVHNRSIVCTHFKTIDCALVCSDNHPKINETDALEQIQQEQFTYSSSEDQGIKDYRSRVSESMAFHKVGFSSGSLLSITNVIASTDTIGFLPKQVYEFYQPALKFKEIKINLELPKIKLFIMYNRASLGHRVFAKYIDKLSLDS